MLAPDTIIVIVVGAAIVIGGRVVRERGSRESRSSLKSD